MYFGDTETVDKRGTFEELERRGAAFAYVHFSGGNDEGHVDEVLLFDEDKNKIGEVHGHWPEYVRDENGNMVYEKQWDEYFGREMQRPKLVPLQPEEESENTLYEKLSAPVYAKYGSFAGDFYVSGTFTWDVGQRLISERGYEQVYQDYDYGEVF